MASEICTERNYSRLGKPRSHCSHCTDHEHRFLVNWQTSRHPSVTDLVKPDLVGYFALPGEILTSLVPGGFSKRPWSILLLPGEQFSFPGDVC